MESRLNRYRYPPLRKCIYCGALPSPPSRLGDEHIIALSLGGVSILPEASCRDCEKITSYLEGYCANEIFGTLRVQAGLPTRRPRNRPTHLPTYFDIDGQFHRHLVIPRASLISFVMHHLPEPGIMRLRLPTNSFDFVQEKVISVNQSKFMFGVVASKLGARGAIAYGKRNSPFVFARMMAKIAHAYCIAESALNGFRPLLPDIILGNSDKIPYLVGSMPEPEPVRKVPRGIKSYHHLRLGIARLPTRELRIAHIRLFATLPTPTYTVIAGDRVIIPGLP